MVNNKDLVELPDAEGYAVDREGVIWSRRPINGKGPLCPEWRPMAGTASNGGRYTAVTCAGRRYLVHRLVALAFHGACPERLEVAHRNGNGRDNRDTNLVYIDHLTNEEMKRAHGTSPVGERNGAAKLTGAAVQEIQQTPARRGVGRQLAERHGISQAAVSMIRSGRRWRSVTNRRAVGEAA